jgi:hypothetical protein
MQMEQVWSKSFNSSEVDGGNSVAKTSDGGYIIAGFKSNASGDQDAWLIKADANGEIQWDKTFGTAGQDELTSVLQAADGGYAMAGRSSSGGSSDLMLIKTDSNGSVQFSRTFGTAGQDADTPYVRPATEDTQSQARHWPLAPGTSSWSRPARQERRSGTRPSEEQAMR